jgi:hypothetical protein
MANIMRHQFADYLNVASDSQEEKYKLMNTGFTSLGESPSAEEESVQYVGDKASTTKVKSYKAEFPYESELIEEEECTLALFDTGRNQKTGNEAMFDYVRVELWNKAGEDDNSYKARKFKVSNVVDEFGADPGYETVSGSLKQVGDFTDGTFNITTNKFTPTL